MRPFFRRAVGLLVLAVLPSRIGSVRTVQHRLSLARRSALRMDATPSEDVPALPKRYPIEPGSVVFLRHGESMWNNAGRFTGWVDVALSVEGEAQATAAGKCLGANGVRFDKVYTSFLQRTVRTAELVMKELEPGWSLAAAEAKAPGITPLERSWRLNERMYGALTGLNKKEVADMYGQEQFEQWVRDPPPLQRDSQYFPGNDALYASLKSDELPLKESFEDCMRRVVPLWEESIKPDVDLKRETILVISSRNAIRALLMHISDIPVKTLLSIDIPVRAPRSRWLVWVQARVGRGRRILWPPAQAWQWQQAAAQSRSSMRTLLTRRLPCARPRFYRTACRCSTSSTRTALRRLTRKRAILGLSGPLYRRSRDMARTDTDTVRI